MCVRWCTCITALPTYRERGHVLFFLMTDRMSSATMISFRQLSSITSFILISGTISSDILHEVVLRHQNCTYTDVSVDSKQPRTLFWPKVEWVALIDGIITLMTDKHTNDSLHTVVLHHHHNCTHRAEVCTLKACYNLIWHQVEWVHIHALWGHVCFMSD